MSNQRLEGKIEACLELSTSRDDFMDKVIKTTGMTVVGFYTYPLTKAISEFFAQGDEKEDILHKLF